MSAPNVLEMVRTYVEDHGYDGLFCRDVCACVLDDVSPCACITQECQAGHKEPCDCVGEQHKFHDVVP